MATTSPVGAAPTSAAAKWLVAGVLVLLVIVLGLVWFGTQAQVAAVRPADIAFLKANKEKPNVKTTASGLQYEVITEGTGASPSRTDTVAVHYEGRLIDGTVFDSSVARGQPAIFALDQVIPGWTEGVQLMKTGSKYRFTIPSELGYGARGAPGGAIPPNAVLVFDVELLGVKGK